MEKSNKKQRQNIRTCFSVLNLNKYIAQKDVIRKIFGYLNELDWKVILMAHNKKRQDELHTDLRFCEQCAHYGHLNLLKWAHEECGCDFGYTTAFAAANGNIDILDYSIRRGASCTVDITFNEAVKEKQMKTLEYLRENHFDERTDNAKCFETAAIHNEDITMVVWLIKNKFNCPLDKYNMDVYVHYKACSLWKGQNIVHFKECKKDDVVCLMRHRSFLREHK